MPFATALGTLSLFLILAYILPAVTILAVLLLLFPSVFSSVPADINSSLLAVAAILVIAFVHSHPCQLIERECLDHLWWKIYHKRDGYSKSEFKKRLKLAGERSNIIAEAEAFAISHSHFDQTLGEFILFLNAGLWLFGLALVRLVGSPWWGFGFEFGIAWVILVAASISVFYVSHIWKDMYIDILKVLKSAIKWQKEHSSDKKK